MSWTGRRLQARSQWKVFGYAEYTDNKTQKKSRLDNLGGNQWVGANVAVLGTGRTTSRQLPTYHGQWYTSQYVPVKADYGCAPAALSMLMKYDGTWSKVPGNSEYAKIYYVESHLPRGLWQGGQDSSAFSGVGSTRVISSKRLAQYGHELGDPQVRDISGASLATIARLVSTGHPVLYYGWSSFNGNGQGAISWHSWSSINREYNYRSGANALTVL